MFLPVAVKKQIILIWPKSGARANAATLQLYRFAIRELVLASLFTEISWLQELAISVRMNR